MFVEADLRTMTTDGRLSVTTPMAAKLSAGDPVTVRDSSGGTCRATVHSCDGAVAVLDVEYETYTPAP